MVSVDLYQKVLSSQETCFGHWFLDSTLCIYILENVSGENSILLQSLLSPGKHKPSPGCLTLRNWQPRLLCRPVSPWASKGRLVEGDDRKSLTVGPSGLQKVPSGRERIPPARCTMMVTGGAVRRCRPRASRLPKLPPQDQGQQDYSFSISESEQPLEATLRPSRPGPRCTRTRRRTSGVVVPGVGAGAGVGTVRTPGPGAMRTPGPGGRRGAAWGAGRGRRPFKLAGPLGGPQPGTAPRGG